MDKKEIIKKVLAELSEKGLLNEKAIKKYIALNEAEKWESQLSPEDVQKLNTYKKHLRQLSQYHPGDDSPFSQYDGYSVRDARRHIRAKIEGLKNKVAEQGITAQFKGWPKKSIKIKGVEATPEQRKELYQKTIKKAEKTGVNALGVVNEIERVFGTGSPEHIQYIKDTWEEPAANRYIDRLNRGLKMFSF